MDGNVCADGASRHSSRSNVLVGHTTCNPGFLLYFAGCVWEFSSRRDRSHAAPVAVDSDWTASRLGFWTLQFSWRIYGAGSLGCCRYVDSLYTGHPGLAPDCYWIGCTATRISPLGADPLWEGRVMGGDHVWLVRIDWTVFRKKHAAFSIQSHQPANVLQSIRVSYPDVSRGD